MRIDGISVIVTCFNGEQWIHAAITSILRQSTEIPLEVIIIDDGSKDGTVSIIESFQDPRIRLHQNPTNLGTARSRNLGISYATHSWLAFNDQDDVWLPEKLASQSDIVKSHPRFDGVAGGHARLAKNGTTRWSTRILHKSWSPSHSPVLDAPPNYNPARHGVCFIQSLLVKKTALLQINGFREDLPIAYDPDLFYRLGETSKLASLEEPVFLYRLTQNSITGPASLDATQFLSGFAYVYAAQTARAAGQPEPNVTEFLKDYRPSTADMEQFFINQTLRSINTHWVNHGAWRAMIFTVKQLLQQPKLVFNLLSRLLKLKLTRLARVKQTP